MSAVVTACTAPRTDSEPIELKATVLFPNAGQ